MGKSVIDVTRPSLTFAENSDLVASFLKDARNFHPLDEKEEKELFTKYFNGDMNARDKIINSYQLFIYAVAKKYAQNSVVMDLVNEGNLGLMDALKSFDPNMNNRFISYAVHYIRRNISIFILKNSLVHKTNPSRLATKTSKLKNKFFLTEGRLPEVDELIDLFEKEYKTKITNRAEIFDLDLTSISSSLSDNDSTFEDSPDFTSKTSSQNEYEGAMDREYAETFVNTVLVGLKPKEAEIIKYLFGIGCGEEHSLEDTAFKFGYTSERIRQIKRDSLIKLRKYSKELSRKKVI